MLTKWNPMHDVESTMDRFFSKPFGLTPFWDDQHLAERPWSPAIDVYEEEDAWKIEASLPGLALDDVKIDVKDQVLTLSGSQAVKKDETKKDYHIREIRHGAFARTFVLPKGIDVDAIAATYKDGVLLVTLPKGEETKPRPIAIEAA